MTYTQISAGGVVYRHHEGALQIQLILDRYGKTSLPKGKMEAGETVEQTALRDLRGDRYSRIYHLSSGHYCI